MPNKELWDALFLELDQMTDAEFLNLANELKNQEYVPFTVGDASNIEVLVLDGVDTGIYTAKSVYDNKSIYDFTAYSDEELAA